MFVGCCQRWYRYSFGRPKDNQGQAWYVTQGGHSKTVYPFSPTTDLIRFFARVTQLHYSPKHTHTCLTQGYLNTPLISQPYPSEPSPHTSH